MNDLTADSASQALDPALLNTTEGRYAQLVRSQLGPEILGYLDDPDVNEVYVNEDYNIRLDTMHGRVNTHRRITYEKADAICKTISGVNGQIISEGKPELGVELKLLQIRAQLLYPPISKVPTFFLRKKPRRIFSLEEYLASGTITQSYFDYLCECIRKKKNVIIAGSTGSGKTTFLNGVLKKLSELCPHDRLLILEDLPELQCSSDDVQYLMTSGNLSTDVSMQKLVFCCMRLSPTRILVGEVRDKSAYDVLKAWNTGHPGGFCTLHADNCEDAFTRLELLVKEARTGSDSLDIRYLIGKTVDAIVSIQKTVENGRTFREVEKILEVERYDPETHRFVTREVPRGLPFSRGGPDQPAPDSPPAARAG